MNDLLNENKTSEDDITLGSSVWKNRKFKCSISYVNHGGGPMINVLTVVKTQNDKLGLLTTTPFCGSYLNTFSLDQTNRKLKIPHIALNDQMTIMILSPTIKYNDTADGNIQKKANNI